MSLENFNFSLAIDEHVLVETFKNGSQENKLAKTSFKILFVILVIIFVLSLFCQIKQA